MKQETNAAATTLEQVNAMPAATWGWLKMNQTKLELSDELAAAPAEAVEVEGLGEQFSRRCRRVWHRHERHGRALPRAPRLRPR